MIYDCFPFFNELDLLEIRLHELADVVDYFVLSEATVTHRNTPKPLYYDDNKDRFRDFRDKIIHNVITDASDVYKGNPWNIDHYMHDNIHSKGIIQDTDLVIIGDADQIVRESALQYVLHGTESPNIPRVFEMMYSYYFFNCVHLDMKWNSSFIVPGNIFKSLPTDAHTIRYHPDKTQLWFEPVRDGGWHFSYMGGIESIKEKIRSFSDASVDVPQFLDDAHLLRVIDEGMDLYNRTCEGRLGFVPLDGEFPRYILDNQTKFSKHIREVKK